MSGDQQANTIDHELAEQLEAELELLRASAGVTDQQRGDDDEDWEHLYHDEPEKF